MQLKFMVSHHKEEEKKLKSIDPIIYFFMIRTKLLIDSKEKKTV